LEILRWMSEGMTNREIAARICFSESTVRLESMAIYRILGVRSRSQAVATARQAGLFSDPMVPLGA
jgi:LuxR family maltose regulon positive regulatory protein